MGEMKTIKILGVEISRLGLTSAVDACLERRLSDQGGYVCFANAHSLTESQHNPAIREALAARGPFFASFAACS